MSSVVKAVVGVVLTVVGFFVVGPLGWAMMAVGASLLLSTALSVLNQKKNAATNNALQLTLNPDEFRKIVFGHAPAGNDLRYWEIYGSNGYDQIIVAATHKVNSFQNLYLEGNACTLSSGNVTETIVSASGTNTVSGFLNVLYNTMGVTATNLAAGAGTLWNSSCSLTGLAYYRFKWTYDSKKLPNGFPSRIVQVVEGALVYDPRRDSTVGGSGSHRANDQTTWSYSTTDSNGVPIGRNNALQMLWYLIGWRIQSPQTGNWTLVAGRGVNLSDIDYSSFILAANECESAQYYTDMVLSTGDTHNTNEGIIASGSQGVIIDTGGLWSYYPAVDNTGSVAVAFLDDDIVSGVQWSPKSTISAQYNQVNGTFIDPSPTSLYQPAPFPIVTSAAYLSADNNFPARLNIDFQCVQSASLAQKLAWIALNKSRLSGVFKATFNFKALQATNYNNVTITFAPLGFSAKPFIITKMSLNPMGGVDLELVEDNSSVYSGGTITGYTTPSQGLNYDPRTLISVGTITATAGYVNGSGGTAIDALQVTWPTPSTNVAKFEIFYCLHGATTYTPYGQVGADVTSVILAPLQPNTSYDVYVRTISVNNIFGAFSSATQSTSNYSTLPAGSVSGLGALATASLTTAQVMNSNVPAGNANLVPFSQYEGGGWTASFGLGVTGVGTTVFTSSGLTFGQAYGNSGGSAGSWLTIVGLSFPVKYQAWYAISGLVAASGPGSGMYLLIGWFDSSGTYLGQTGSTVYTVGGQTYMCFMAQCPYSTAVSGKINAQINLNTATGAVTISLAQGMVTPAIAGQTVYPAFTPGPNSYSGATVNQPDATTNAAIATAATTAQYSGISGTPGTAIANSAITLTSTGGISGAGGGAITALDFGNVAGSTKPANNADVTATALNSVPATTSQIATNAVTNPNGVFTSSASLPSSGAQTTITSITVTTAGGPVQVLANTQLNNSPTGSGGTVYLYRGSTLLLSMPYYVYAQKQVFPFIYYDSGLSAGTYTYSLQGVSTGGSAVTASSANIIPIEFKR